MRLFVNAINLIMSSYFTTATSSIIKVLQQKILFKKVNHIYKSVVYSVIFVYLLVPLALLYYIFNRKATAVQIKAYC